MSETRERSALEVLRRFNQLVDERHLVVMGPQDLTDPLWDDIEALLEPTPASDGGEVREATDAEVADACLSYRHDYGLMDTMSQVWLHGEARAWLSAWRKVDPALLSGSGTPPGEGERGLIMRAMLETFPWSPDIRQEHFERAADAVIAALRDRVLEEARERERGARRAFEVTLEYVHETHYGDILARLAEEGIDLDALATPEPGGV